MSPTSFLHSDVSRIRFTRRYIQTLSPCDQLNSLEWQDLVVIEENYVLYIYRPIGAKLATHKDNDLHPIPCRH
jgi:hypothetical protein